MAVTDARDTAALMAEQVFRIGPAIVFFADQIFQRRLDVFEPNLIDLRAAVQCFDGSDLHTGLTHVDQDHRDTALCLGGGVSAGQTKHPVGIVR